METNWDKTKRKVWLSVRDHVRDQNIDHTGWGLVARQVLWWVGRQIYGQVWVQIWDEIKEHNNGN